MRDFGPAGPRAEPPQRWQTLPPRVRLLCAGLPAPPPGLASLSSFGFQRSGRRQQFCFVKKQSGTAEIAVPTQEYPLLPLLGWVVSRLPPLRLLLPFFASAPSFLPGGLAAPASLQFGPPSLLPCAAWTSRVYVKWSGREIGENTWEEL